MRIFAVLVALLLSPCGLRADSFTIDHPEEWRSWQLPEGLVRLTGEGHLELVRYRRDIDPIRDAALFSHPTLARGEVRGGIWRAGSNPAQAGRIVDGDRETFWQPDPADPLAKWEVEIDLGRAVLARQIRLVFPDREGARPLRQFSVYVATGATINTRDDIFKFDAVYQTTLPNGDSEIRIDLSGRKDTTRALDPGLNSMREQLSRYRVIQYIRIGADEKSADAALAEVEVTALGDNVSLGALKRGGTFRAGLVTRDPQFMIDGDMNTHSNKFTVFGVKGDWKIDGLWWELDLGALFWIDGLFLYFNDIGEGASGSTTRNGGTGFSFLFSDGRRTTSGEVDYTHLVSEGDEQKPFYLSERHFLYLFRPRQVRFVLWHGFVTPQEWHSRVPEMMLFAPGYPAQVTLRSHFIDLGQVVGDGRPKAIKNLSWATDAPPGTRLQLRSRSGNALREEYTFYDKKGEVVTESKWNSLPKVIRGEVDTATVVGEDWGPWSNVYQFSGESFQSESPRRFVQLEAILSTEDPQVAPRLRSLSIEFEDALVRQAQGRVVPRQVRPNEQTRFTYTLWSRVGEDDSGYDVLRLVAPGSVLSGEGVVLRIGGQALLPERIELRGDSLLVFLPAVLQGDSLEVGFSARVLRNATVFALELGHRQRPGLWQSVEATERRGNVVFLPELTRSQALIGDLEISPPAFTPNGDGLNDALQIRFVVFKVRDAAPRVRIYDLAGRLVAELEEADAGERRAYAWSGRDASGAMVAPGLYLCHIDLGAEFGEDVVVRPVAVVY